VNSVCEGNFTAILFEQILKILYGTKLM